MAQKDLTVTKVFEQDGKQIGYEVKRADGSKIKVDKSSLILAVKQFGHTYTNATISDSGVVRVNSDVPREVRKTLITPEGKNVRPDEPIIKKINFPDSSSITIVQSESRTKSRKNQVGVKDLFEGFKITKYKLSDVFSYEDYLEYIDGLYYNFMHEILNKFLKILCLKGVFNTPDDYFTSVTYITNMHFLNFTSIVDLDNGAEYLYDNLEIVTFTCIMNPDKELITVKEAFYKEAFGYLLKWADKTHVFNKLGCTSTLDDTNNEDVFEAWVSSLISPLFSDSQFLNLRDEKVNNFFAVCLIDAQCLKGNNSIKDWILETSSANEAKLLIKFYTELAKKIKTVRRAV